MSFSGALKLADVSDFIAPSQACVINFNGKVLDIQDADDLQAGNVQLQPRSILSKAHAAVQPGEETHSGSHIMQSQAPSVSGGFAQTRADGETGAVKVSLQDCLACSGCVTSAETVLLEHQSIGELRAKLQAPDITVIISISPQSRASLAAAAGLSPRQCQAKLASFFKALGAARVLDLGAARDMALLETAADFVARYLSRESALQLTRDPMNVNTSRIGSIVNSLPVESAALMGAKERPLPLLASSCPGWVCYAEKTQGAAVLPHISSAKSPQAVQGSAVKRWLAPGLSLAPESIYHCAVMMCYDKKLEAAREDFMLPGTSISEVDSVLSTLEVQQMLEEEACQLSSLPDAPTDSLLPDALPEDGDVFGYPGGAGGCLEFVFRYAAKQLWGVVLAPGPLALCTVRNADFKEVVLEVGGRTVLRFATAYGFRNIQTLMRQMKHGRCKYDFVEIMVCPSGCLNGGGQLRAAQGVTGPELLEKLEHIYQHPEVQMRQPQDNPLVPLLYQHWVKDAPRGGAAQALLHTQYHARTKTVSAQLSDW